MFGWTVNPNIHARVNARRRATAASLDRLSGLTEDGPGSEHMSLGDIQPTQPILQLWPYAGFPDRIPFDGSAWDRVAPWTQLEGWKNPSS